MTKPVLDVKNVECRLPEPQEIRLFTSTEHFLRNVYKHFLNPLEPWYRLLGQKFLLQIGRKLKANDVSGLEQAYELVICLLKEGLQFAESTPLFLRLQEEVKRGNRKTRLQWVVFLLAEQGFIMVIHNGAVRTAYFANKTTNDSNFTLFLEGWRTVKARGKRLQYSVAGENHRRVALDWYSAETWSSCPIPARYNLGVTRNRIPRSVEEWLDAI